MSFSLDAHVLLLNERADWRNDALADIAKLPCNLHVLDGIHGHLAVARKKAWSQGQSEFLTWFDPDDRYPTDDALHFLTEACALLNQSPNLVCVYSAEQRVNERLEPIGSPDVEPFSRERAFKIPSAVHGVIVMRRSVVDEHKNNVEDFSRRPEFDLIKSVLAQGNEHTFIRLPYVARLWRQHTQSAHRRMNSRR